MKLLTFLPGTPRTLRHGGIIFTGLLQKCEAEHDVPPPPQRQTDTSTSKTDRHLSSLGSHFQHPKPHQPKKRAHGRERKKTAAPAAEAASRHPYAHGPAAPHGTSWRSVDLRAQSSACIPGILFLSSRGYRTVPQPAAVDPHPSGQAWRRVFIVWRGTSRAGWYAYHVLTGWREGGCRPTYPPTHLLSSGQGGVV